MSLIYFDLAARESLTAYTLGKLATALGDTGADRVINGEFTSGTTGWPAFNCTLASVPGGYSGNCLEMTRIGGSYQNATQVISGLTVGREYRVVGRVKSGTAGDQLYYFGNGTIGWATGTSSGTWTIATVIFTATRTSETIYLEKETATAGTMLWDSVTLFEQAMDGHVYVAAAGTTATAQPIMDSTAGAETTDGTVTWTECTPPGIAWAGRVTLTHNPEYGGLDPEIGYIQPVDRSAGGDVYCYDKGLGERTTWSLPLTKLSDAERDSIIDLIRLVRGSKFTFIYGDEEGVAHEVWCTNASAIKPKRESALYSSITLELEAA